MLDKVLRGHKRILKESVKTTLRENEKQRLTDIAKKRKNAAILAIINHKEDTERML